VEPTNTLRGNEGLCGGPLRKCGKTSKGSIIVVVIVVGLALGAIGAVIFILSCRSKPVSSVEAPSSKSGSEKKTGIKESEQASYGSPDPSGSGNKKVLCTLKLTFVRDDREMFDLQDLLRASAEILGSGCFGSSYKAGLMTGSVMVVKRFKQMNNVGKEEFQEHMRKLGSFSHPNLLPLVAYYYRKEEKLLVYDYVAKGSLADHIHGHKALGQLSLDWPTRLKIVKGIAKGLQYLYTELPSLIVPHGHLKSSNVLLNEYWEPLLTDYGLVPVVNQEHAQQLMVVYKSPEYSQLGRITKKTDVWSFGILILEILTGKIPSNFLQKCKGSEEELASWVNSIVPEEWTEEVFDKEMRPIWGSEGEMLKLLKIGLDCCEGDVEKRCDWKEVVERIEKLREQDGDDDDFSYTS